MRSRFDQADLHPVGNVMIQERHHPNPGSLICGSTNRASVSAPYSCDLHTLLQMNIIVAFLLNQIQAIDMLFGRPCCTRKRVETPL